MRRNWKLNYYLQNQSPLSLLVWVFLLSFMLGCAKLPSVGYNKSYAPEQPLLYDHAVHAGKLKLDCQYCHYQVTRSKQAAVPDLKTCMNCHLTVRSNKPEVKKLVDAYLNQKSIRWVRVNMLPDFVRFDHRPHVALRGFTCQSCHGPVETMAVYYQHSDLSMGWCVRCHDNPQNNPTGLSVMHGPVPTGPGPKHCGACHY